MRLVDKFVENNRHLGSDQVPGGGIVQETIIFRGTIIGEGQWRARFEQLRPRSTETRQCFLITGLWILT